MAYMDDPVLRLLPEPPVSLLVLPPEEQFWRGRLWITLYGAGYDPDYAWILALQDEPDWVAYGKSLVINVIPNDPREYAAMIDARQRFDAELARQAESPK